MRRAHRACLRSVGVTSGQKGTWGAVQPVRSPCGAGTRAGRIIPVAEAPALEGFPERRAPGGRERGFVHAGRAREPGRAHPGAWARAAAHRPATAIDDHFHQTRVLRSLPAGPVRFSAGLQAGCRAKRTGRSETKRVGRGTAADWCDNKLTGCHESATATRTHREERPSGVPGDTPRRCACTGPIRAATIRASPPAVGSRIERSYGLGRGWPPQWNGRSTW
jgi:hypothetical protein